MSRPLLPGNWDRLSTRLGIAEAPSVWPWIDTIVRSVCRATVHPDFLEVVGYVTSSSDLLWRLVLLGMRDFLNAGVGTSLSTNEVAIQAQGQITGYVQGNGVSEKINGHAMLQRDTPASLYSTLKVDVLYGYTDGTIAGTRNNNLFYALGLSDIDAIRFFYSSGNISSGIIRVYGR